MADADDDAACILAALLQIAVARRLAVPRCTAYSLLLAQPWQAPGGARKRTYGSGSPHKEVSLLLPSVCLCVSHTAADTLSVGTTLELFTTLLTNICRHWAQIEVQCRKKLPNNTPFGSAYSLLKSSLVLLRLQIFVRITQIFIRITYDGCLFSKWKKIGHKLGKYSGKQKPWSCLEQNLEEIWRTKTAFLYASAVNVRTCRKKLAQLKHKLAIGT